MNTYSFKADTRAQFEQLHRVARRYYIKIEPTECIISDGWLYEIKTDATMKELRQLISRAAFDTNTINNTLCECRLESNRSIAW